MPIRDQITLFYGYQRFRQRFHQYQHYFKELAASGQNPQTMFISCSDSRVDPANILDCAPGEIFVVRNVANLVPHYQDKTRNRSIGAALEFAVQSLEVKNIIVMGHSQCGGIKALLEAKDTHTKECQSLEEKFISDWIKIANEARDNVTSSQQHLDPSEQSKACEEQALLISLKNLETYPWIAKKIKDKQLTISLWRFDISKGVIYSYNPKIESFEPLNLESFHIDKPTTIRAKLKQPLT